MELRWLPLTELTHIFFCDSVCVSSMWVTTCQVHVGTCTCRFMKVDPNPALVVRPPWRHFFLWHRVCLRSNSDFMTHVRHVHVGTCTCRFMKARAKTCCLEL